MSDSTLDSATLSRPLSDDETNELAALLAAERMPQDTMDIEQLDGFLASVVCAPRMVMPSRYLPAVFGEGEPEFPDSAAAQRFFELLMRRSNEIAAALSAPVELLDDPRAYSPLLVDWRGNAARIAAAGGPSEPLPAYGEMWARGFMRAVELTDDDWDNLPAGDEEGAELVDDCLDAIAELVPEEGEEDDAPAAEEPPRERIERVADAIWACYDLREYVRSVEMARLRPKEPIRRGPKVGRNDPCPCGSGRKFKHCHGRDG